MGDGVDHGEEAGYAWVRLITCKGGCRPIQHGHIDASQGVVHADVEGLKERIALLLRRQRNAGDGPNTNLRFWIAHKRTPFCRHNFHATSPGSCSGSLALHNWRAKMEEVAVYSRAVRMRDVTKRAIGQVEARPAQSIVRMSI